MGVCGCVNPSPNCPCHRDVSPLTWGPPMPTPRPAYWWWYPQQWPITTTVTTKTTYVPASKPDVPALRPEDV